MTTVQLLKETNNGVPAICKGTGPYRKAKKHYVGARRSFNKARCRGLHHKLPLEGSHKNYKNADLLSKVVLVKLFVGNTLFSAFV